MNMVNWDIGKNDTSLPQQLTMLSVKPYYNGSHEITLLKVVSRTVGMAIVTIYTGLGDRKIGGNSFKLNAISKRENLVFRLPAIS